MANIVIDPNAQGKHNHRTITSPYTDSHTPLTLADERWKHHVEGYERHAPRR